MDTDAKKTVCLRTNHLINFEHARISLYLIELDNKTKWNGTSMPLWAQMLGNVTWDGLPDLFAGMYLNQVQSGWCRNLLSFRFDVDSRLLRGLEGEMAVQSMECLVSCWSDTAASKTRRCRTRAEVRLAALNRTWAVLRCGGWEPVVRDSGCNWKTWLLVTIVTNSKTSKDGFFGVQTKGAASPGEWSPWMCEVFWTLRDCCSHLCEERLQPSDNFEEKELQNKMKEWGRTLKWAGRGFVWRHQAP